MPKRTVGDDFKLPLFSEQQARRSGRRRYNYGAVVQHELGQRRLLTFTIDGMPILPRVLVAAFGPTVLSRHVIAVGWLLGRPQDQPKGPPLAHVAPITTGDRQQVLEFLQRTYPDRLVTFWRQDC